MDYITVGEIIKAQGIGGEVKVRPLTADIERFRKLRVLYAEEKPYRIMGLRLDRDYAYIKLQGVDTRNAAEELRGKFLQIDRINAVDLEEDEYFISDLIGCGIFTEENILLGKITDVSQSSGSVDVISARSPQGKEFRFPFLKRIVVGVDVAQKRFAVMRKLLEEVCVYDD